MFYLVMAHDDARGTMVFDAPWYESDGRMSIQWDGAGREIIFTRINEELRRHARALQANFISNPLWDIFKTRHLVTAHPLGGCPLGEDYLHGAADEFGQAFRRRRQRPRGALCLRWLAHPLSAECESFPDHLRAGGADCGKEDSSPAGKCLPPTQQVREPVNDRPDYRLHLQRGPVGAALPALHIARASTRSSTRAARLRSMYPPRTIRNDQFWKGFFPHDHILNTMSSALFTGFKKEFHKQDGHYTGITSDTDDHIHARNSLEEINLAKPTGTLEAGKYILLKYLDPPWQGFYDIFKVINQDLLIGRVYLGEYPNGARLFTFPMTRKYSFEQMTVDDHAALYAAGAVPTAPELEGVWRMDVISNANHASGVAYLQFQKPDGRFVANYHLMGLMEGLVTPAFLKDHFQLNDFTTFHDEIRKVTADFLVGKYMTALPAAISPLVSNSSLGLFHTETGGQFGFYYMLTEWRGRNFRNTLLSPFLEVQLPDGIGMTFSEEMVGWFFDGATTPTPAVRETSPLRSAFPKPARLPAGWIASSTCT